MQQSRSSILVHVVRTIRGRKSRTAAIISTSILLVIAAWFALGPIDQEPNAVAYQGDRLRVLNRFDRTIAEITVGNTTVENWGPFAAQVRAQKGFSFGDADGDGKKDLFYFQSAGPDSGEMEQVCAWSITEDRLLWRISIAPEYSFPDKPETRTGIFNCSDMLIADADGDRIPELFVSAHHTPSFPGLLCRLNVRTGAIEQMYVHAGHISDIWFDDIDEDGRGEILACGVNNAFATAFVTALDARNINGCSLTRGQYRCDAPPPAHEKTYILIPRSIIGNLAGPPLKNNGAWFIEVDVATHNVKVTVNDGVSPYVPTGWPKSATLNYTFNGNMELLTISDGNDYEVMWDLLRAKGELKLPRTAGYFLALGKGLMVWRYGRPAPR